MDFWSPASRWAFPSSPPFTRHSPPPASCRPKHSDTNSCRICNYRNRRCSVPMRTQTAQKTPGTFIMVQRVSHRLLVGTLGDKMPAVQDHHRYSWLLRGFLVCLLFASRVQAQSPAPVQPSPVLKSETRVV